MEYQPQKLNTTNVEPRPILDEISVVIPTLGRPILEESLHWIIAGSAWPGGLIVVDQGNNHEIDGWLDEIARLGIKAEHVLSSQRGRAAAVNRGIERVQTPFFAVTDDDCFVDRNWLERLVAQLHEHPRSIVTGRVEAANDSVIFVVTSTEPRIYHRPRLAFDTLSGGNMGTSLSVMERVGLFDEDPCLRTAEDGEFAYRALRAGIPIVYAPDVSVRHLGWRVGDQRVSQYRDYAYSHGGFYGKYLRRGDWFIALRAVAHHLRALRRWLRGIVTGDKEMANVGRSYFVGLMPGIIAGMGRKAVE